MYEMVFADADPDAVRLYNKRIGFARGPAAMHPLQPLVDWDGNDVSYGEGVEVSVLSLDEPEDRELETLMNTLGATAATIRKVEGVTPL